MKRGFTLAEVIVALVLLELGVLGAFGVLLVASRTVARAERVEIASLLADEVADSLASEATVSSGSLDRSGYVVTWTAFGTGAFSVTVEPPGLGPVIVHGVPRVPHGT